MYSFLVCAKFQPISASFTPVRWEVGISFLLSAEISQTHKKRIRKTLGQFIAIYFSLFSRNSGPYFKLVLIYMASTLWHPVCRGARVTLASVNLVSLEGEGRGNGWGIAYLILNVEDMSCPYSHDG